MLEPFRRGDERADTPLAQWRPPIENEDEPLAASIGFLKAALAFASAFSKQTDTGSPAENATRQKQ